MSLQPPNNSTNKNLILNLFSIASKRISQFLMALCGLCLILMMGHVCIDILLKLALNRPLIGTLETVSYYYMVSVVFLPLAYVELRNDHVNVDLFFQMFSRRKQLIIYILGAALSASYVGVVCYKTGLDALKALKEQETIMSNFLFYVWPSRWALPIGFGAYFLAILSNAANALSSGEVPHSQNIDDEVI